MALKQESHNDSKLNSLGIKVKGDLGDLQIVENSGSECSDDDERTVDRKQKAHVLQTISTIPTSLIQNRTEPIVSNVQVHNSENIQFGHNTYFHGPVTIKQIIKKKGIDNASYTSDNENEHNATDSTQDADPPPMVNNVSPWLKMTLSITIVIVLGIVCVLVLYMQSHNKDEISSSHDDSEKVSTNYTKVVGMCYDSYFQILVFSIIVVPITILLILYPLLTSHMDYDRHSSQANGVAEVMIADYPQGDFNDSVEKTKIKADPLLISPNHLRIVSRTDWLAQPVESELQKIRQPVPWVVITHTATEPCSYQSECVLRVRLIQMFHIEAKKWDDIGYNFLVAGDGSAYFGRGWEYIGAHTLGYNRYSIGIAFVGTFNSETPPKKQIEACQKLIKLGVQQGKIAKDYKLFAHRQLTSTLSPGDRLYDIIKQWPHFVKEDTNIDDIVPKNY
ncbi:uncharacterized protein LOC135086620 isoform X1 [Ostrinia nubilalis]|uniref:uncharacterized protein LOC135086620 isoform X1 n=1 Tax=Ostrinia nubilalis TaxID=29057 RepID=UPI0030825F44